MEIAGSAATYMTPPPPPPYDLAIKTRQIGLSKQNWRNAYLLCKVFMW